MALTGLQRDVKASNSLPPRTYQQIASPMTRLMLSRLVDRLAALVIAALLALFCTSTVASSTVMTPFESHYSVDYSGFRASRVVSLERTGSDYILRSTTTLKGLAQLSGFGPVYEVSRFEMHDGVIRPLLYTVGNDQNKHKRDIRIEFDWKTGLSRGFAKNKEQTFPLESGMQDPLTFELMARLEFTRGQRAPHYLVHEGHRIRDYVFVEQESETLKIAGQSVAATRFFIDRSSSRELYYWFASKPHFTAIQLRQEHNGKVKATVKLNHSTMLD